MPQNLFRCFHGGRMAATVVPRWRHTNLGYLPIKHFASDIDRRAAQRYICIYIFKLKIPNMYLHNAII